MASNAPRTDAALNGALAGSVTALASLARRVATDWPKWFGSVVNLSVVSFERGLDAFTRTVGDPRAPRAGDCSGQRAAPPPVPPPPPPYMPPSEPIVPAPAIATTPYAGGDTAEKEGPYMTDAYYGRDDDFGGDDIKLVRFRIVFDQFDEEALLYEGRELVNYTTTSEGFASRKLSDFLQRVFPNGPTGAPDVSVILDDDWKRKPAEEIRDLLLGEPRKYLSCRPPQIIDRWPRRDKEYDKEQVSTLKEMEKHLEKIANKPDGGGGGNPAARASGRTS